MPNHEEMIKHVTLKNFGGDTAKRWYVEYREFNPDAGTWQRHRAYGHVNREKDPHKRLRMLEDLQAEIMGSLASKIVRTKRGESEIHNSMLQYLADKKQVNRSIKNMKLALRYFYEYLKANALHMLPLQGIRKQHIHEFRRALTQFTSNRSVNNHIGELSAFFQY